ncbi:MAG TPA: sporulation integral membrane protein YtvI [Bacilli bacterium]
MDKSLLQQLLRAFWVLIIITLIWFALLYITPLIYPFIIGLVVAYMLNPFVRNLELKAKFPRWLAVTAALTVFLAAVTLFITLIITRIVSEISKLVELINENIDNWIADIVKVAESVYIQNLISQINIFYKENENYQDTINKNISTAGEKIGEAITSLFGHLVDSSLNLLASLPTLAAVLIVALLAAFFICKDWHKIMARISALFPETIKAPSRAVWSDLQKALFGYVRAQLILITITAVFVFVGLLLFRVEYAFSISLLIGFVDLLPYLGTGAVMVPWAVYTFISGNIPLGIGLSILYGIVLVVRQLIEPKILSKSIGLDALSTLIAMFVGLKLFGVLGLIIGPIVLIVLSAFYRANVFKDIYHYVLYGRASV